MGARDGLAEDRDEGDMLGDDEGDADFSLKLWPLALWGVIQPVVLVVVVVAICGSLLVDTGHHRFICGGTNTE